MSAASNSEARKRAAERAAVESTLAVSSPGQCCDGWCVDDIGLHHVDRQTAQDVAESSGLFFAARIEQARAEGAAEALSEVERRMLDLSWSDVARFTIVHVIRLVREGER